MVELSCGLSQVRRLRDKLDAKQLAVCQRDEQLNSRNVELVFLAGQLAKVGEGHMTTWRKTTEQFNNCRHSVTHGQFHAATEWQID